MYALIAIALLHTARGRHLMSEQPSSALADHLAALAKDKTVIVTQVSCGYLEFADNWIASVNSLDISNWIAVAQDQAALDYLSARQAQCQVSNPPPYSVLTPYTCRHLLTAEAAVYNSRGKDVVISMLVQWL